MKIPLFSGYRRRREEAKRREEKRQLLRAVNKEAAIYYYKLLRTPKGRKGLQYLADRKLDPVTMRDFGLGYADGSGNDLVAHLKSCGYADDVTLEAGVAAFDESETDETMHGPSSVVAVTHIEITLSAPPLRLHNREIPGRIKPSKVADKDAFCGRLLPDFSGERWRIIPEVHGVDLVDVHGLPVEQHTQLARTVPLANELERLPTPHALVVADHVVGCERDPLPFLAGLRHVRYKRPCVNLLECLHQQG